MAVTTSISMALVRTRLALFTKRTGLLADSIRQTRYRLNFFATLLTTHNGGFLTVFGWPRRPMLIIGPFSVSSTVRVTNVVTPGLGDKALLRLRRRTR